MDDQFSLFEPTTVFPRSQLAQTLASLAQRNILIGTSSWRYPGWLGQIYSPELYSTRGKFSEAKFEAGCIREYAEVFPVVGADFSFYAVQPPAFWTKLFSTAPEHLKWSLKVPEMFTRKRFSNQERYGPQRGQLHAAYLNADQFIAGVLEPVMLFTERIAVLMFEFGSFSKTDYSTPELFCEDLARFFEGMPQSFRYAVEIRNEEFLGPGYFSHATLLWRRSCIQFLDANAQLAQTNRD